jgi:hypothetical protein
MTILLNDLKVRASQVMADVPEGGGGPSATTIEYGDSNTIFDDVSTLARTVGEVSIRQLHMHVDTPNTDRLLGSYAIVAKPPSDPNVEITLAECAPFARRSEIATAIADYLIRGTQWPGFLLENHVQNQNNIQIFQRVGQPVPTIGRTLVLVVNEGLGTEALQYVRIIEVEAVNRTFTDTQGDYPAQVVKCSLQSGLTQAFPGTSPNRLFTVGAGKTTLRDTSEADAANYYGSSRTLAAHTIGETSIKVDSIYSQLVPSSSTPVSTLDQRPAAVRSLTLATAPRQVDVSAAPHARRIKISQENRISAYIGQMVPPPEPNTCVWTWVSLGNRYSAMDNGDGTISGNGAVGTVNSTTGSWSISLPALPDIGSAVVSQWGARIAYTNRSTQGAAVRAPEYSWVLDGGPLDMVEPATLVIGYTSGGTVRTCTAAANGTISGDGTGHIDHPSRTVVLTPAYMIDPGGEFDCQYDTTTLQREILTPGTPDVGGFITVPFAQQPTAGTLRISWATAQEVSQTSGGTLSTTKANSTTTTTTTSAPRVTLESYQSTVDSVLGAGSLGTTWPIPSA